MRASLLLSLEETARFWHYDVSVDFARPYSASRLESLAQEVPGIIQAESWQTSTAGRIRHDGSESSPISVVAPPASTDLIRPIIAQGRWLLSDDQNAVVLSTLVLRDEPDLELGDELVLKFGERQIPWQVVGFARLGMTGGPTAYVNYPYLARVLGKPGMADGLRLITDKHDPASQMEAAWAMEKYLRDAGVHVSSTVATAELQSRISSGMMGFVYFLLFLAVMLALVGGLGLMGTMSLNVLERTREIGVMRAIGASSGAIMQIFVVESIIIALASWLGGVLLAFPLSKLLSDQTGMMLFKTPFSYTFAPMGILAWLVLAVVVAVGASYFPARNATRLTVREVLAYE